MRRKMIVVSLKLLHLNFLKGLRTNTNFTTTNRVPTENLVPPEYKSEALLLSVIYCW